MLARCVGRLQADPSLAFVHTATAHRAEDGRPLGTCDHDWPDRVEGDAFRLRIARRPGRSPVEAQTVVMRRTAFEAAGPFRDDWVQATDLDQWLRLSRHGAVGFVREPLVDVRIRASASAPTTRDVRALGERLALATSSRDEFTDAAERARAAVRWQRYLLSELLSLALRGDDDVRREAFSLATNAGLPARLLGEWLIRPGRGEWPRRGLRVLAGLRRRVRSRGRPS